jgi:hypothetical protein
MLCGHPNVFGGPGLSGFRVVSDLPSSARLHNQLAFPANAFSRFQSQAQSRLFELKGTFSRPVIFFVFSNLKHGDQECRFVKRAEKFGPYLEKLFGNHLIELRRSMNIISPPLSLRRYGMHLAVAAWLEKR